MEVANKNGYYDGSGEFVSSFDTEIPYRLQEHEQSVVQDTLQIKKDSVSVKPTRSQIRYRNWQREKKLMVGNSRYMQPKGNTELVSSIKVENNALKLPMREKNNTNADWLTLVLIIALILVASVRVSYSKYMGNLFQSLVNYSTSFRMFREKNYSILHGAFRLDFLFYIIFSVFVYQVLRYFKLAFVENNLIFFASVFILVVFYFYLKKVIYLLLGLLFEGSFETKEYLFNADNFNRSLGLVLFPVIAIINYYPVNNPVYIVFTGILIVLAFYILLIQRGFSILLRKHFSIFYLFLYLCTLEFLPLLLIYKVVVL